MVGTIFAWLIGLALFNFAVFTVCWFWTDISRVLITPLGMYLALLLAACFAVPLAIIHYVGYRKKEGYRKQMIKQKVEASRQQKDIGLDF